MMNAITKPRAPVTTPRSQNRKPSPTTPRGWITIRTAPALGSGLAVWLTLTTGLLAAPTVSKFKLLTSSGPIGTLSVTENGNEVDTDFRVDDNGRGPKIKEHIVLGSAGQPVRWEMEGHTDCGGPVKERLLV